MNTQCMQNQLATRGDGVIAAGLRQSKVVSSLKALYAGMTDATARVKEGLARAQTRRAAIRQLSRLSDRQLTDIGIERSRIVDVVDGQLRAAARRGQRAGR